MKSAGNTSHCVLNDGDTVIDKSQTLCFIEVQTGADIITPVSQQKYPRNLASNK